MSVILNRADLANHMGVSLPTIDRWVKEGAPVKQRGSRGVQWEFDLAEIIRWYGDRRAADATGNMPADEAELKKRKLLAETLQAELALAKAKGEVAPIEEFKRAQAAAFAQIRANIMNVPQRVVTQLLGETDETEFKRKLRAELVSALVSAASTDPVMADDEDDDIPLELNNDDA